MRARVVYECGVWILDLRSRRSRIHFLSDHWSYLNRPLSHMFGAITAPPPPAPLSRICIRVKLSSSHPLSRPAPLFSQPARPRCRAEETRCAPPHSTAPRIPTQMRTPAFVLTHPRLLPRLPKSASNRCARRAPVVAAARVAEGTCEMCGGTKKVACAACGAVGFIHVDRQDVQWTTCEICVGSGKSVCAACREPHTPPALAEQSQ